MPDKVSVENLCSSEFGCKPQIVRCRRLGQLSPSRVGAVHSHRDVPTQNSTKVTHNHSAHTEDCGVSDTVSVSTAKESVVVMPRHEFISISEEDTVNILRQQVDFITSFLGITDTSLLSPDHFPPLSELHSAQQDSSINSGPAAAATTTIVSNNNLSSKHPTQYSVHSYSSAIQKSSAFSAPFRNAVVSAVYADFEEKDRWARNIVISRLIPSSMSDKVSVENLCSSEFGCKPQIVRCRRLGQPRDGRVQPLLVVLNTVDDAEFLINNAKRLRQSSDYTTRSSVYINPDLTKAEALTAYHRRCRRRELAAAATVRRSSRTQTTDTVHHSSIPATGATHDGDHVSDQQFIFSDHAMDVANITQPITVLNTRLPPAAYSQSSAVNQPHDGHVTTDCSSSVSSVITTSLLSTSNYTSNHTSKACYPITTDSLDAQLKSISGPPESPRDVTTKMSIGSKDANILDTTTDVGLQTATSQTLITQSPPLT